MGTISNDNYTLETTVKMKEDGTVYVITGDIPAMWLRDSTAQIRPFLFPAKQNGEIQKMIAGLVKRQFNYICLDPYANAFNEGPTGACWEKDDPDQSPWVWERKFEVDSLCYPIQLAWMLWKNTGCTEQFEGNFRTGARKILNVFCTEQNHEHHSAYRFVREDSFYTDTLSREGRGACVKPDIGMVWSGFRPSDDACTYGFPDVKRGRKMSKEYEGLARDIVQCVGEKEKKSIPGVIVDFIAGSLQPIIPALSGEGMVKALLAVLVAFELVNPDTSQTYYILNFFADAVFYYLPILIAFTEAQKLNCNPVLAAAVAGIMLHPSWGTLVTEGSSVVLFGLHNGVAPLGVMQMADLGYDSIFGPGCVCSNIAQGTASLIVAWRTREKKMRQMRRLISIITIKKISRCSRRWDSSVSACPFPGRGSILRGQRKNPTRRGLRSTMMSLMNA